MSNRKRVLFVSLFLISFIFGTLQSSFGQSTNPIHPGEGARRLTPAQMAEFHKTHYRIKSINLNSLGLNRVNAERAKNHLSLIEAFKAMPLGKDIESVNDFGATIPQAVSTIQPLTTTTAIPTSVDNSAEAWFPPIGNQGYTNSCTAWASTYYQLTYMNAMSKDWTVNNGDTTKIFSPKWTYNMMNGGVDRGPAGATGTILDLYPLFETNGAATMSEFPWDGNVTKWDLNPNDWQQALSARTNVIQYVESPGTDAASVTTWITQMKQLLANGYILTFGTYVDSWRPNPVLFLSAANGGNACGGTGSDPDWAYIATDPANPSNVGQKIFYWQDGGCGGHAMNIVGYDDTITVNVGGTHIATGAFKIANQWGNNVVTNNGFMWLSYDALYSTSQVGGPAQAPTSSGGYPATGRWPAIWDNQAYQLTVKQNYSPKMIAKFTINIHPRNALTMTLGTSQTSASNPSTNWTSNALNDSGGSLAFDGSGSSSAASNTATFVLDFTDILPSANTAQNYYLEGLSTGTLSSYQLIDLTTGTTTTASNLTVTGGHSAPITYTYSGHTPPTAKITLDPPTEPVSGSSPLTVQFDGSSSTSSDGNPLTYSWDFGDGTTGLGVSPSHTYVNSNARPVFYNVVLTVTDDQGGIGTYTLPTGVSVSPLSNPPVGSASLTQASGASGLQGAAPLTINYDASASTDPSGTITAYNWNFGDGATGSGETTSHTFTTTSSTFNGTLTITDSRGANVSIALAAVKTTSASSTPQASLTASTSSPTTSTVVTFNGSGSTDTGGTITSYNWSFGDGTTTTSTSSTTYTYSTAGSYQAKLQVVDNHGITSAWSNPVNMTVTGTVVTIPPTITTQPASVTVTAGGSASFTASASGTPTPSYQWLQSADGGNSWTAISGATSNSYTIASTTTAMNGNKYEMTATNSSGTVTSSSVILTVNAASTAPSISTQPANATVTAGASANFSVIASGNPTPTYQWMQSTNGSTWTNISGATSATYTTSSTTTAMNGYKYKVGATNSAGSVTSNAAVLTVSSSVSAGTCLGGRSFIGILTGPHDGHEYFQVCSSLPTDASTNTTLTRNRTLLGALTRLNGVVIGRIWSAQSGDGKITSITQGRSIESVITQPASAGGTDIDKSITYHIWSAKSGEGKITAVTKGYTLHGRVTGPYDGNISYDEWTH